MNNPGPGEAAAPDDSAEASKTMSDCENGVQVTFVYKISSTEIMLFYPASSSKLLKFNNSPRMLEISVISPPEILKN